MVFNDTAQYPVSGKLIKESKFEKDTQTHTYIKYT